MGRQVQSLFGDTIYHSIWTDVIDENSDHSIDIVCAEGEQIDILP